jgi:hypothetical protein
VGSLAAFRTEADQDLLWLFFTDPAMRGSSTTGKAALPGKPQDAVPRAQPRHAPFRGVGASGERSVVGADNLIHVTRPGDIR